MKIVADTNVLISALLWTGTPSRLIQLAEQRRIQFAMSSELVVELHEVLSRKKLAGRLRKNGTSADQLVLELSDDVELVTPQPIAKPANLRDADDVHVLACAVAAEADAIVTGDLDLLALKSFQGIPIMTATEILKQLK